MFRKMNHVPGHEENLINSKNTKNNSLKPLKDKKKKILLKNY